MLILYMAKTTGNSMPATELLHINAGKVSGLFSSALVRKRFSHHVNYLLGNRDVAMRQNNLLFSVFSIFCISVFNNTFWIFITC